MTRGNLKDAVFGLLEKEGLSQSPEIKNQNTIEVTVTTSDLVPALFLYFRDKFLLLALLFFVVVVMYLSAVGWTSSMAASMVAFLAFEFFFTIYMILKGIPTLHPSLRRYDLSWSYEGLGLEYVDKSRSIPCLHWLLIRTCKEGERHFLIVLRLMSSSTPWDRLVVVPKRSFMSEEQLNAFRESIRVFPAKAVKEFHKFRPEQPRKFFIRACKQGFLLIGFGVSTFVVLAADAITTLLTGFSAQILKNEVLIVLIYLVVSTICAFVWVRLKPISDDEVFESNN